MENAINHKIICKTKANTFLSSFIVVNGILYVGDKGVDFRSMTSKEYIVLPYKNIKKVKLNILFKKWIHSMIFVDNKNSEYFFVISKASKIIRSIKKHLNKDVFSVNKNYLTSIFNRGKKNNG